LMVYYEYFVIFTTYFRRRLRQLQVAVNEKLFTRRLFGFFSFTHSLLLLFSRIRVPLKLDNII